MSIIKLSVVIPSRNRPGALIKCLTALNKERHLIYEIIVGDDSSPLYYDSYQKIKDRFKVKLIRGKKKGLYVNHNLLYKTAQGSHVRTIDDDHIIPLNHIYKTLSFIKLDKKSIWTIGEKLPLRPSMQDKGFYPGELNSKGYSEHLKDMDNCIAIGCGSTIYPIEIFKVQKAFYIEKYIFGSIWLEFGPRLKMLGNNIRVIPNTFVNHYYNESKRSFNIKKLDDETRLFLTFFYNLIYKKNTKNILSGIYQIIKYLLLGKCKNRLKILYSAYKNFINLKANIFWNN